MHGYDIKFLVDLGRSFLRKLIAFLSKLKKRALNIPFAFYLWVDFEIRNIKRVLKYNPLELLNNIVRIRTKDQRKQ